MSLDALGAAIQLERVRATRRPAPGGAPPRTREEAATPLAPFDEPFELAAGQRARAAEIRRTEIRSRIANHHLESIFRFRSVLQQADRAAEDVLALADRASDEADDDRRAALSAEANGILAALPALPSPEGPTEPPRGVDLTTPDAARDSARRLEDFRDSVASSAARLEKMRDLVLDNVSDLASDRRRLREVPNGRPSPRELAARVEKLRARLLEDPRQARTAQANLPRGLVLVMLRGR